MHIMSQNIVKHFSSCPQLVFGSWEARRSPKLRDRELTKCFEEKRDSKDSQHSLTVSHYYTLRYADKTVGLSKYCWHRQDAHELKHLEGEL